MMDASKILSVLYSEIHSVVVGMIDSARHPSSAFLDVIFAEENAVYFMTSDNGRKLYHLLNSSDYISICGKTEGDFFHAKMISMQGRVRNIGKARVDELIDANPYMKKLYPDDQRKSAVSSMSFRSMKDMAAIRTSALLLRNRQGSNFIVILNKAGTYE